MPSLILRYAFALPSLQVRFKSVPSPFLIMGLTWDLQGRKKGIRRDKQKRMQDKDGTELKLREKQPFANVTIHFFCFLSIFCIILGFNYFFS